MKATFPQVLKNIRQEAHLSQQQLADKLFVNRSTVAHWENGTRFPDAPTLARIARYFQVKVDVLLQGDKKSTEPPQVIIVDDESILLEGAIPIIRKAMPQAEVTGFTKASEAIAYAREHTVSIAFLDIEIGTHSGLDLSRTLIDLDPFTNVIFLTSYPDYAMRAWDTQASGFLVKPLSLHDVQEQLKKLRHPIRGLDKA